jgi:mannose-1-phosphate guanylyltransferase
VDDYFALIMAGGGGTRLWPLSRRARPKQSLRLLGDRTMFEIAVDRLLPLFAPDHILVVTNAEYAADLQQQRPQVPARNYVIEPGPRGTAPAIALGAAAIRQRNSQAVMACLTADHHIGQEARFRDLLRAAGEAARQGYLVTLGIDPTFASTGFGYIQRGERLAEYGGFEVFRAARFKEKPKQAEAEALVADGLHTWNSGMFVWRAERFLGEVERQMPALAEVIRQVETNPASLDEVWGQAPNETVDYGIMEGARDVVVIPAGGLEWNDIGSWEAVLEVLGTGGDANVVIGAEHVGVDTSTTLVHSSNGHPRRLVATVGLDDVVIVETEDVLLVCRRDRSQDVKQVVERLKQIKGGEDYL